MGTIRIGNEILEYPDDTPPDQLQAWADSMLTQQRQAAEMQSAKEVYEKTSRPTRFLTGAGATLAEFPLGLAQLANKGLAALGADNAAKQREIEDMLTAVRGAKAGTGRAGTAGDISTWLIGGLGTKTPQVITKGQQLLSRAMPRASQWLSKPTLTSQVASRTARAVPQGAAEQAAYEASRGTLEGDPTRLQRAAAGAEAGGLGGLIGGPLSEILPRAGARILEPITASPAAQALVKRARGLGEQLDLSIGQAMGKGSTAGSVEEALAAIPGMKLVINKLRGESGEQWNRAELNEVLRTADPSMRTARVSEAGSVGIGEAQQAVKDAYTDALRGVRLNMQPNSFDSSLNLIQRLPESDAATAMSILQTTARDISSGNVAEDAITRLRSEVGEHATKAYREGNYPLGRALDSVVDNIRTLTHQGATNLQQAMRLRQADKAYAKMADINRAAAMQGATTQGNVFTPSQLISSMRRGEPESMVASARTPGLQQAQLANEVLGDTLPKPGPGTAEKLMTAGLIGGGAGYLESNVMNLDESKGTLPALALLAYGAAGTRGGRARLMPGLYDDALSRAQVALADALRRSPRGPVQKGAQRSMVFKDEEED